MNPHTALVAGQVYQQQNRRRQGPDYFDVGSNQVVGRSLTLIAGLWPGIAQDAAVCVFAGISWTIKDAPQWR